MKFAKQLAKAREKAGFSLEQVAAVSGYSYASIYKYEQGTKTPPVRSRKPLIDAIERACKNRVFQTINNPNP